MPLPSGRPISLTRTSKRSLRRRLKRGLNAVRRLHMIPAPPQQLRERTVRILVIFHQQNPHRFARRRQRRNSVLAGRGVVLRDGKHRREGRALVLPRAFRGQVSAMRFDQRLADGQAETQAAQLRPLALLESIENFRQRLGVDSHPAIGNLHAQLPVVVRGPDFEPPAFRREFHRVLDQVPKNLLQPGRIGFEANFLGGEIRLAATRFFLSISAWQISSAFRKSE